MRTNIVFYLLLLTLSISCDRKDDDPAPTATKEEIFLNISYGTDSKQTFDLYLPANRSKTTTKTIILVHGGGWIEGDKADMNYIVDIIKQNLPEYAIANLNYRLATVGKPAFPMQIDDIISVVSRLKNANYEISNNLGFIGTSAGGHLSLLYSYAYNTNNNVKMVASIVGPTNFTDVNYTNNPEWISLFYNVTGVTYAGNQTYYENLSPLFRATTNAPPTIMLYGNADPLIPTTQGQSLHAKLDQLGVYNEFNLYNGGHGNWAAIDQLDAYTKLVNFIKKKL